MERPATCRLTQPLFRFGVSRLNTGSVGRQCRALWEGSRPTPLCPIRQFFKCAEAFAQALEDLPRAFYLSPARANQGINLAKIWGINVADNALKNYLDQILLGRP